MSELIVNALLCQSQHNIKLNAPLAYVINKGNCVAASSAYINTLDKIHAATAPTISQTDADISLCFGAEAYPENTTHAAATPPIIGFFQTPAISASTPARVAETTNTTMTMVMENKKRTNRFILSPSTTWSKRSCRNEVVATTL